MTAIYRRIWPVTVANCSRYGGLQKQRGGFRQWAIGRRVDKGSGRAVVLEGSENAIWSFNL